MRLQYAFSQLSAWAESGRAADPAVDASIRATEIDDLGRKAFVSGREALGKVIGELKPDTLDEAQLDKFVVRSLAIVVAVWEKGLSGPGTAHGTAHHRALVAEMRAFATWLGAHPDMPGAVRQRMHDIVPPEPEKDAFDEVLERADEEFPDEEPEQPKKRATPVEYKEPTELQKKVSWATRNVHPGWWGALILVFLVAIATCSAD